MAEDSWPSGADGRQVNDAEYEQMLAAYSADGLTGSPTEPPPVYGNSTGMQVYVRNGKAAIVRGRLWVSGSTDVSLPIAANTSGSTRNDLIVLRLDRSDSFNVRAKVRQGSPGGGTPGPVQDIGASGVWEMPLAQVRVAAGASSIAAGDVTTLGWCSVPGGGIACTFSSRPPHFPGRRIYEVDSGWQYVSTGTAWIVLAEDTGWVPAPVNTSDWAIDVQPVNRRMNNVVFVRGGELHATHALAADVHSKLFGLQTGYRTGFIHHTLAYMWGHQMGDVVAYHSTSTTRPNEVWMRGHPALSAGDAIYIQDMDWPVDS